MVYFCCIPFCKATSRAPGISFFQFPPDKNRQDVWMKSIYHGSQQSCNYLQKARPFIVKKHIKICSQHFLETDFCKGSKIVRLLPFAVPTQFPWTGQVKSGQEEELVSQKRESPQTSTSFSNEFSHQEWTELNQMVSQPENIKNKKEALSYAENLACTSTSTGIPPYEQSIRSSPGIAEMARTVPKNLDHTMTSSSEAVNAPDFRAMYFDSLIECTTYKAEVEKFSEKQKNMSAHSMEITHPAQESNLNNSIFAQSFFTAPMFSIEKFKHDTEKIEYYTGFYDYNVLKLSLVLLFGTSGSNEIKMNYRRNHNSDTHWQRKLSREDEYFLVLIKLRQDFGFKHLSTLFGISVGSVGNIFTSWINYIFIKLGSLNIWPHRDVIISNSPPEFQQKYKNVLGNLDATELFMQTPSSLLRQSQTYSQYKSNNTVKGLIVTDPNGAIIFVSSLFTGSISDKKLIQECGFLDTIKSKIISKQLLPGDIFLADKGFKIQDLMDPHNISINIPVFRITGTQFSPEEVEQTRYIAHERIQVERAIRRVKTYKILSHEVPVSFLGSFNQIWTVCCFLSNFQMPLRKPTT